MIRRILVGLSGTRYTDAAIEHALELARHHGAEVAGVTDVDLASVENVGPVPIGGGAAAEGLAEHRRQLVEGHIEESIARFETACCEADVRYSVHRAVGEPFDHLINLWRYHDLTILGLQGLFEYEVIHKPDDVLLRLMSAGVRPIVAVAETHRTIEHALIAYNGSMESAKAMKRFVQMHLWPGLTLTVACFELPAEAAETLLADAATYCRTHGYEPLTEYVEGSARDGLLACAERCGADLIVMGATARSRLFRRLLGDTALHTIQEAKVPLFLAQ